MVVANVAGDGGDGGGGHIHQRVWLEMEEVGAGWRRARGQVGGWSCLARLAKQQQTRDKGRCTYQLCKNHFVSSPQSIGIIQLKHDNGILQGSQLKQSMLL